MTVISETQPGRIITPRLYQEELFRKARDENVIAVLGTGGGKTLISAKLMEWIACQDVAADKIIVFLAPQKALVDQQGEFIAAWTRLRVTHVHGETAPEMTDRAAWARLFSNLDVMIMTPQLFLNTITHSHWSLIKVSLMILDECHHTHGNNPCNAIMREYFQCSANERPKIFGMTASPFRRPHRPKDDLAELERNLDARVITVEEHAEELQKHLPRPVEVLKEYAAPPATYPDYLLPFIWSRFDYTKIPSTYDIPWSQLQDRLAVISQSLGPFGAEIYLFTELQRHLVQLALSSTEDEIDMLRERFLDMGTCTVPSFSRDLQPSELRDLHEILQEYKPFYQDDADEASLPPACYFNPGWCTPKVQKLIEILTFHSGLAFQGIVFVDQRCVAAALARVIARVPQLKDVIRCSEFVGQATGDTNPPLAIGGRRQKEVVKAFRRGELNLLIATSVAEEGLDFPACDLVVRFDPMKVVTNYVQSRGRARHETSTFVVMIQEGDVANLTLYQSFVKHKEESKHLYRRPSADSVESPGEASDDYVHPEDLLHRERFVVSSTQAILTYGTAITLLNRLCDLIPCDKYIPPHKPRFEGDFESTLYLPNALPLPPEYLTYTGPTRHSKKEAKRAVAFQAVKALHGLEVFDDYLLPTWSPKAHGDLDGRPLVDVSKVPIMMDVDVKDPWTLGAQLWAHPVIVDGRYTAALVTGTALPPTEIAWNGRPVRTEPGRRLLFAEDDEREQRTLLQDYTNVGLWWCVTSRPISLPLSCFLVPVDPRTGMLDYDAMQHAVDRPLGDYDWTTIDENHHGHLLIMNRWQHGRPYLIHTIRHDLNPMSKPPAGSREEQFATYRDNWIERWTRRRVVPDIPVDGPLVEARIFQRQTCGAYRLFPDGSYCDGSQLDDEYHLLPFACCKWLRMPEDMFSLFSFLPRLLHRLTDVWRVTQARFDLGLPAIPRDLLVEAYTLPAACAGFSNQRLETLGDSVLKLGTSVHLFNKFPYRHEGQLDALRRRCVTNKALLSHAKEINLERYLTSEGQNIKTWRYTVSEEDAALVESHACRRVRRRFDRRSLQDCMEATIGASYVAGGIPMALQAGTALGLNFGGMVPWSVRYSRNPLAWTIPSRFDKLQEALGYRFHRPELLIEAMTHPSFPSIGSSYQRLEFLGDAVIDLVVMTYLFNKYPKATSHQLSWPRSRAVCAPVLAYIAVKRLGLHQLMMAASTDLSAAINKYTPILLRMSPSDIVLRSWAFDPPKAVSDVFESLIAAVFIDSAYDFDKTSAVVELVMDDILEVLAPDMPPDPVSQLMVWTAQSGCKRICVRKSKSQPESKFDTVTVVVHDVEVVKPLTASSISVAKAFACEAARVELQDSNSDRSLSRLCTCGDNMNVDSTSKSTSLDILDPDEDVDDGTEEGYLVVSQAKLEEVKESAIIEDTETASHDDIEGETDSPELAAHLF